MREFGWEGLAEIFDSGIHNFGNRFSAVGFGSRPIGELFDTIFNTEGAFAAGNLYAPPTSQSPYAVAALAEQLAHGIVCKAHVNAVDGEQ